ncbi:MAG: hypothetical protein ACRENQ_12525 [Gemmatimonadaceae bacterium]
MTGRVQALILSLALCAATAGAQTPSPITLPVQAPSFTPSLQVQQRASVGPVLRSSAVGVRSLHQAAPLDPTAALAATGSRSQSRAMMIVGGAALIVGAIIGGTPGTIVMIGGGVVGLIGLYNYLE